jgi:hypothetical protein
VRRERFIKRRSWDDNGNISVLSLGFAVVVLMMVLVVSAATVVHLQQMRLMHLADELALDAADALDIERYYGGDALAPTERSAVTLAESRMRDTVSEHVNEAQARLNLDEVRVVEVRADDDTTATVTISVVVRPLFGVEALLPFANGIELVATGSARAS